MASRGRMLTRSHAFQRYALPPLDGRFLSRIAQAPPHGSAPLDLPAGSDRSGRVSAVQAGRHVPTRDFASRPTARRSDPLPLSCRIDKPGGGRAAAPLRSRTDRAWCPARPCIRRTVTMRTGAARGHLHCAARADARGSPKASPKLCRSRQRGSGGGGGRLGRCAAVLEAKAFHDRAVYLNQFHDRFPTGDDIAGEAIHP